MLDGGGAFAIESFLVMRQANSPNDFIKMLNEIFIFAIAFNAN